MKTKLRHTPGPWEYDFLDDFSNPESGIAYVMVGDSDDNLIQTFGPDCKANATLIAAAPDLLKACELAKETLREAADELPALVAGGYDQVNRACDALHNAIRKATQD